MKTSKNTWVHAKLAHYLLLMLKIYPYEGVMNKNIAVLDQYVQQSLTDANPEARLNGRRAFLVWQKLAPHDAD